MTMMTMCTKTWCLPWLHPPLRLLLGGKRQRDPLRATACR